MLRRLRVNMRTKDERIRDLIEGGGQSKQDEEKIAVLEQNMEAKQEQAVRDKMAILKLREDNRAVFNKLKAMFAESKDGATNRLAFPVSFESGKT